MLVVEARLKHLIYSSWFDQMRQDSLHRSKFNSQGNSCKCCSEVYTIHRHSWKIKETVGKRTLSKVIVLSIWLRAMFWSTVTSRRGSLQEITWGALVRFSSSLRGLQWIHVKNSAKRVFEANYYQKLKNEIKSIHLIIRKYLQRSRTWMGTPLSFSVRAAAASLGNLAKGREDRGENGSASRASFS